MRVADVMAPAWARVATDVPLGLVAMRMHRLGLRHLPVVHPDGTLFGTISDATISRLGWVDGSVFVPFQPLPALLARSLADVGAIMAGPNDELSSVLFRLAGTRLDHVVVVNERTEPIGLVTEHALLEVAALALPSDLTVDRLLERELIAAPADALGSAAMQLMLQHGIRHLPVVASDGSVVGVVSFRDLVAADVLGRANLPLSKVHSRDVFSVARGSSLALCAQRMARYGVGCLPILASGRAVGIVTRRDIVTAAAANLESDGRSRAS